MKVDFVISVLKQYKCIRKRKEKGDRHKNIKKTKYKKIEKNCLLLKPKIVKLYEKKIK